MINLDLKTVGQLVQQLFIWPVSVYVQLSLQNIPMIVYRSDKGPKKNGCPSCIMKDRNSTLDLFLLHVFKNA